MSNKGKEEWSVCSGIGTSLEQGMRTGKAGMKLEGRSWEEIRAPEGQEAGQEHIAGHGGMVSEEPELSWHGEIDPAGVSGN